MAKNQAKTDTKVELSWVTNTHPQNQTKFKLGYYFFLETNNVNAQTTQRILADLPYVFRLRFYVFCQCLI